MHTYLHHREMQGMKLQQLLPRVTTANARQAAFCVKLWIVMCNAILGEAVFG
jgi:hypothetical protein